MLISLIFYLDLMAKPKSAILAVPFEEINILETFKSL
jgi:hypothetical protein